MWLYSGLTSMVSTSTGAVRGGELTKEVLGQWGDRRIACDGDHFPFGFEDGGSVVRLSSSDGTRSGSGGMLSTC
jgi:hypothetical protein